MAMTTGDGAGQLLPAGGAAAPRRAPAHRVPPPPRDAIDTQANSWLVGKAKTGDVDAYEVLVRRHRDRIYRIALRMLGNPHDAEDVTQDVVIALWTTLAGFAGTSAFTTWLYRVVVNRCLNVVRNRRPVLEVVDEDPPSGDGAEDVAIARQRARATMAAITALPDDMRTVLVLHQIEGLSYQEVADILGVPEPTVRGRLHRARRRLLNDLKGWA